MNMLIKIVQNFMPEFIKKKKLNELFRLTADAFQTEMPSLRGLTFRECLSLYAFFSREQAERCIQGGCPLEEVKSRLYQNSFLFGKNLRKSLPIITLEESVAALRTIYKLIGVDFHYDEQGEFIIKQCFYSDYYTAEVCMLISSMDEGLAEGLSAGGKLHFTHRITDGSSCCKGYLKYDNK